MSADVFGLVLTATPAHHTAAPERTPAHLPRDGSPDPLQPLIRQLSIEVSRWIVLLEALSRGPAQDCDDLAALAWIRSSLEDVRATIIGLSEAQARDPAAFQGPARFSDGDLAP